MQVPNTTVSPIPMACEISVTTQGCKRVVFLFSPIDSFRGVGRYSLSHTTPQCLLITFFRVSEHLRPFYHDNLGTKALVGGRTHADTAFYIVQMPDLNSA